VIPHKRNSTGSGKGVIRSAKKELISYQNLRELREELSKPELGCWLPLGIISRLLKRLRRNIGLGNCGLRASSIERESLSYAEESKGRQKAED
jgi:hypothetical protein